MKLNKKGALELSINAIVVLILAITILGLGIAFIRGQFGALGGQFTQVSEEVRTEMINKMRESGELVMLQRAEITIGKGQKETVYFGLTNTETTEKEYTIDIMCKGSLKTAEKCTKVTKESSLVGTWVNLPKTIKIPASETGVYPMVIQPEPGTVSDVYIAQLEVTPKTGTTGTTKIIKQMYITVK
jgi:hypothetical protein